MVEFEKAFGDFVESEEYDRFENEETEKLRNILFAVLRAAYKAGWIAAGGILLNLAGDEAPTT